MMKRSSCSFAFGASVKWVKLTMTERSNTTQIIMKMKNPSRNNERLSGIFIRSRDFIFWNFYKSYYFLGSLKTLFLVILSLIFLQSWPILILLNWDWNGSLIFLYKLLLNSLAFKVWSVVLNSPSFSDSLADSNYPYGF